MFLDAGEASPGKYQSQSQVNSLVADPPSTSLSPLFKIFDLASGVNFLVDTGSQLSILPASTWDKQHTTRGQPLVAANGTSIATFGTHAIPLHLGEQVFQFPFVMQPILGADFLHANSLLVDVKGH